MLKLGRSLGYCPGGQDAVGGRTMALTKKKWIDLVRDAAPCLSNLTNSCQLLAPPVCPRSIALLEVPMDSVRLSQLVCCLPSEGLSDGPMC